MISDRGRLVYSQDCVGFARDALGFSPDAKQAEVLWSGSSRSILNCSRQWGKSTVTAIKAVHRVFFQSNVLVLVASPGERQSGEHMRKSAGLVRRLGLKVRGDGFNESSILLPNGSRIVGLPCVEDKVRGFSAVSLLVIDEAARVPDEMYQALRPMLATSNGDLLMMSTPRGKNGFFYRTWTSGGEEWHKTMAPGSECARIAPSFLEEERAEMGEEMFRREYCCEFTDDEEGLFKEEWITAARRSEITPLWGGG